MTFLSAGVRPALRRRLALGALIAGSMTLAPEASAIDIQVGSVDTSRFPWGWTLNGTDMTRTRAKMLAATEIDDGFTVAITDTADTLTELLLSQFDIFFVGYLQDAAAGAFSTDELDAMVNWVTNGGQMIVTCDHVDYDAVCNRFGYALDSLSAQNPAVVVPGQESHPIFDGPYGGVSQFLLWGSQGGFSGFPAGAELLAQSSNVPPLQVVMFERIGSGSVIALSDVDIISNYTLSDNSLLSGAGTNDNDHLLGNILARVDALIDGDNDNVRDLFDNCPLVPNPAQTDADGDSFGAACDCDDTAITVNPLALEACDGIDNDCDPGTVDGADEAWLGLSCDGGDSDLCKEGVEECILGARACADFTGDDLELCDGIDNDCNAATPDGADEPGFGDACDGPDSDQCAEGTMACTAGSFGCTDATGDTLDLCDGADNDCNPATPDGADEAWHGTPCDGPDSDLCNEGTLVCDGVGQTCSDTSDDTLDVCDGADNDCDPASADGSEDPSLGASCDGDDSDLCEGGVLECVSGALDCDDPGTELELCDGVDNDCNPATSDGADETWYGASCDLGDSGECAEGAYGCVFAARACSVVEVTVYADTDGDGCGDPSSPILVCPADVPTATVTNADDADDTDGACCGNGLVEVGEDCDWGTPPPGPAPDAGVDAGTDAGAGTDASAQVADAAPGDAAADGDSPLFDPTCPLSCVFPVPDAGTDAAGGTGGAAEGGGVGGAGAVGGVGAFGGAGAEAGMGGAAGSGGAIVGGAGGTVEPPGGSAGSAGRGDGGSAGTGIAGMGGADAGVDESPGSSDPGGCGCRVPARTPGDGGPAALLLLALAALRRRRS